MNTNTPTTRDENQRNENRFETICRLTKSIAANMNNSLRQIDDINMQVRLLSFNAQVQAAKAGEAGRTFSVVANEIGNLSTKTAGVAESLAAQTSQDIKQLAEISDRLASEVSGNRLVDLALTNIDLIDRNLYERSCDVRWWATDTAVVEALEQADESKRRFASERLGVILNSYTVYLDLWIADLNGNVIANGRPELYPGVVGSNVADQAWFRDALATASGDHYAAQDIEVAARLGSRQVATYSTAVREGGRASGRVLGALGIFFDWGSQAAAVVNGVRLTPEEKKLTRCMLVDREGRIIASSDGKGILDEKFRIRGRAGAQKADFYTTADGTAVGFAETPGDETYPGLGWFGVIEQKALRAD